MGADARDHGFGATGILGEQVMTAGRLMNGEVLSVVVKIDPLLGDFIRHDSHDHELIDAFEMGSQSLP